MTGRLKVWIVQAAEPLPDIDGNIRLGRCSLVISELLRRGHSVVWWSSCFNHFTKSYRHRAHTSVKPREGLEVRMLFARPGYYRNVSLLRVINQKNTARAFAREVETSMEPDLIYTCLPTPELAEQAVVYGEKRGIPVVVDVRDLWPDLYLSAVPSALRPLVRFLLRSDFRRVERLFRRATSITAVSRTYLDWARRKTGSGEARGDRFFPLGVRESVPPHENELASVRLKYGIPSEGLRVVFSGVFGRSYDLESVVDCARWLKENGESGITLILIGSGDKEAALKKRAGDLPNVIFTGWLKQGEMFPLLCVADVGLSCYTSGAFQSLPNKPFDYLAAGLAIANSLKGELWELIENEGIGRNYKPGSGEALAETLVWFRDHPEELASQRRGGRELFSERFSESRIYPQMVDFLEDKVVEAGR